MTRVLAAIGSTVVLAPTRASVRVVPPSPSWLPSAWLAPPRSASPDAVRAQIDAARCVALAHVEVGDTVYQGGARRTVKAVWQCVGVEVVV